MQNHLVNKYFVVAVLEPLSDPDKEEWLTRINSDDEDASRKVIRELLVPYYLRFDEGSRDIVKDTLRYYLSGGKSSQQDRDVFEDMFEKNYPALATPNPARKIFVWLWEEMYGSEPYDVQNIPQYFLHEDGTAANRIRVSE